ncbi:MAG TPA: hypothetical protein PLY89_06335 [Synergistaceae bacterium]|nr:hypothetical protein [Synergistaceae bacterium]
MGKLMRIGGVAAAMMLLLGSGALAGAIPKGKAVAVVIAETAGILSNAAVGTAETLVKQTLMQHGYPVVNEAQLAKIRKSKAAALALDGNVDAILSLGKKYGVKIFVSGKATMHESRQNEFGLFTGTAAIAVQAYSATDGKYLFADTVMGKDLGYTPEEAGQKALMAAARVMAENIVRGEGAAGDGTSGGDPATTTAQTVMVVVSRVGGFNVANQILDACSHLPRTRSARITSFSGGTVAVEVLYQSTPRDLADSLSRRGLPINITGVRGNTVEGQGY